MDARNKRHLLLVYGLDDEESRGKLRIFSEAMDECIGNLERRMLQYHTKTTYTPAPQEDWE
ncbi:uncharacterized protein EAE97_011027 [Botrytis byssoidea]|uniref:Uncharacterized protein n=1 Tax=Botrytis byssoidea TaxID=139641 RepID=A0A9P5I259_9HELO|nr:uncharacterized protein EAE97_011027 [Botrytis byssoidea]KAF7922863.1 hypothetical protein EAE97_011027 [Botrytis byssoidea]